MIVVYLAIILLAIAMIKQAIVIWKQMTKINELEENIKTIKFIVSNMEDASELKEVYDSLQSLIKTDKNDKK